MKMPSRTDHLRQLVLLDRAALLLVLGIVACSSRDSTSPPPPPEDQWNVVAEGAWTMPAEAEGYRCVGVRVTSDEYITGFRLASPASAQNEVLLTVSDAQGTEGAFDCSSGSLNNRLIYAASLGTDAIEFPTGFGVHVSAGQYLLLNIHVVNTADTSVMDSTRLEGRVGTAADVVTAIDMSFAGSFLINIPSDGQEHTSTGYCLAAADTHVLAFLPLMRSRGVHQTVDDVNGSTHNLLFDQDFDFQHDSYTQLTTPVLIHMGDKILTQCSYVNNSGQTENYGEASANESCFSAIYRYPVSTASNFLACANNTGANFEFTRE
jgi:copper type II ascorbate-dependent monooxygenase-like protein